jgi:hypothetical protein
VRFDRRRGGDPAAKRFGLGTSRRILPEALGDFVGNAVQRKLARQVGLGLAQEQLQTE